MMPVTSAAGVEHGTRHLAHEADAPPAIDEANAGFGHHLAKQARGGRENRVGALPGTAIDTDGANRAHASRPHMKAMARQRRRGISDEILVVAPDGATGNANAYM